MRKVIDIALATALILSVVGVQIIAIADADPFMPSGSWSSEPIPPSFNVQSPSKKLNYWIGSDVWLDFTVTVPLTDWYSTTSFRYPDHYATSFGNVTQVQFSLDGNADNKANQVSEHEGVLSYSINLGRLTAGQHTIIISAEGLGIFGNLTHDISITTNYTLQESGQKFKFVQSSINITFVVDSVRPTTPPNLTLLSPTNQTYYYHSDWTSIPYVRLEYKADDTHLSIGYSLNGDSNITPVTNGSKINIPIQSRRLTLYANDSFGNSATPQTVYYEIQRSIEPTRKMPPPPPPRNLTASGSSPTLPNMGPTSPPELILALPVFAAAGALIIITLSIVFWVYFKKYKGKAALN